MRIAVVTPLEPELVARIERVDASNVVWFEPALLPEPRYPSDHRGRLDFARGDADEKRFWSSIAGAEILYGIPGDTGAGLAEAIARGPLLRWIAGTAAGAGEQARAAGLSRATLERVAVTTAAGVHGGMLAEFVFYGLLALRKDARRLERIRAERAWEHYAMGELDGSTVAIVGMGSIGRDVARRARAFGMRVVAVNRSGAPDADADATYPIHRLGAAFAQADAVVVTLPGTDRTHRIVDRAALDALRPNAIFCNVGRGMVVDQDALVERLASGTLAGAVLDVFDPEPLPAAHPLWTMPNVIFSPHTAALSVHENARIADLFCDNLRRFSRGEPLRNRIDPVEFY